MGSFFCVFESGLDLFSEVLYECYFRLELRRMVTLLITVLLLYLWLRRRSVVRLIVRCYKWWAYFGVTNGGSILVLEVLSLKIYVSKDRLDIILY